MKTDDLEKFVIDNREEFDEFTPDPAVWAQIQSDIKPVRKISWTKIAMRAAAVVVIFITSYVFHDYMSHQDNINMLAEEADAESIEEANSFYEAKAYYTSMIENRQEEVNGLVKEYPEIKKDLKTEFKELDGVLTDLQKDLKDGAANEMIVEAMIQNYRIKLEILEEVLNELKIEKKDINHEQTYNI